MDDESTTCEDIERKLRPTKNGIMEKVTKDSEKWKRWPKDQRSGKTYRTPGLRWAWKHVEGTFQRDSSCKRKNMLLDYYECERKRPPKSWTQRTTQVISFRFTSKFTNEKGTTRQANRKRSIRGCFEKKKEWPRTSAASNSRRMFVTGKLWKEGTSLPMEKIREKLSMHLGSGESGGRTLARTVATSIHSLNFLCQTDSIKYEKQRPGECI